MQQPFLAEEPDIQIDAGEGAERADGIGAILEDTRCPNLWICKQFRQLLVLQLIAGECLLSPPQCRVEPRAQPIDGIHGAWVVNVIARFQRRIEGPGTVGVQKLKYEVLWIALPGEDP